MAPYPEFPHKIINPTVSWLVDIFRDDAMTIADVNVGGKTTNERE